MILRLLVALPTSYSKEMTCEPLDVVKKGDDVYMNFNVKGGDRIDHALLLGQNSPNFKSEPSSSNNFKQLAPEKTARHKSDENIKVKFPKKSSFDYDYYAVSFYDKNGNHVTSTPFKKGGKNGLEAVSGKGNAVSKGVEANPAARTRGKDSSKDDTKSSSKSQTKGSGKDDAKPSANSWASKKPAGEPGNPSKKETSGKKGESDEQDDDDESEDDESPEEEAKNSAVAAAIAVPGSLGLLFAAFFLLYPL